MKDRVLVGGAGVEARLCLVRALVEERDGGLLGERLDRIDMLAREVEDNAASDQQGQARCPGEQVDEEGTSGAEMLGIVDNEQELEGAKR